MNKNKLTTLMLISAAGLLLTWGGLRAGASQASHSMPPSMPPSPLVDDLVDRAPQSPQDSLQRVQVITLSPALDDLMQVTWPVQVNDTIYNKAGGTALNLPADACDNVTWTLAIPGVVMTTCNTAGTVITLPATPDSQPWVAVTYRTRTRAVRYRDLVTVTAGASGSQKYNPITVTFVYDRKPPPGCASDYWGDTPTFPILRNVSPPPTDQSDEERWVRWVENDYGITGTVVLSEPLFGSDLTITQLLMSPAAPKFGERTFFTATIQNIGVMTAWRWYAAELDLKPASAPPPQNANDHVGGWDPYSPGYDKLFFGRGDWRQLPLGPGQINIVTTAITISVPGTFKAYGQVDTAYNDPCHYIFSGTDNPFWGSNSEGYGMPPYPEERNVLGAEPFTVKGSVTYLPLIRKK